MDLSVVIPAKNEGVYLRRSIPALLRSIQTGNINAEIILVDNESTDDTASIGISYGCKVITSTAKTIAALRNLGANYASGEFLAFVDADCEVHVNWVQYCLQNLAENNINLTGTRAVPFPATATWVSWSWFSLAAGSKRNSNVTWLGTSNLMLKRQIFNQVAGFDQNLISGEDANFTRKISKFYEIRLEKRIDTIHHREPTTLKNLFFKEVWRGKSSLECYIRSGCLLEETASILVPILVNIFTCLTLYSITCNYLLIPFSLAPLLFFPLILMHKKGATIKVSQKTYQTYLVALTFILARSYAIARELIYLLFYRSFSYYWNGRR